MPSVKAFLALALVFTTNSCAKHLTISLTHHRGDDNDVGPYGSTRFAKRSYSNKLPTAPVTHASVGFWYGLFDVGESKNLRLVIDTGSPIVVVDPNLYKPGPESKKLKPGPDQATVMSYGTAQENGCGTLHVKFEKYEDTMTFQGLTAKGQHLAIAGKKKPRRKGEITQLPPPYQGIVGLLGNSTVFTEAVVGGDPFFHNLCNQSQVEECRFGLAFGTSGEGKQILGGVDNSLFEGELSTEPLEDGEERSITGALTIDGKPMFENQGLFTDSGTPNIVGPMPHVRALFHRLGIQAVELDLPGCEKVLYGYYSCDAPPRVGFRVGGTNFDIEPSAFKLFRNGGNNCTSVITGVPPIPKTRNSWTVGQAWFQGKYIDHNDEGKSMGFAKLKDPVHAK